MADNGALLLLGRPDAARAALDLPPGVRAVATDAQAQRVSSLSRAYRVNLAVLALVALFVGGFLVFSVLALSVAQRTRSFALLACPAWRQASGAGWCSPNAPQRGAAGSVLALVLGLALDGSVRPLAYGLAFWVFVTAGLAWTLVQCHGTVRAPAAA